MAKVIVGRVGEKDPGYLGVYVGRGSPLGNPFRMRGEGDRELVCQQYLEWIISKSQERGSPQRKEIKRLRRISRRGFRIRLECFCHPRQCHADTIKMLIEKKTL